MKQHISIFYSWQSGPFDRENRHLIHDALKQTQKKLESKGIIVTIEQDTRGEPGSPDIADVVFQKIKQADVFVGDISTINPDAPNERKVPNPNVMIEMGYAVGVLGWERVISVCNLKFGKREDAPFDLRKRRIVSYSTNTKQPLSDVKRNLANQLLPMIERICSTPRPNPKLLQVKARLSKLLMDALRYAWHDASDDDMDESPSRPQYPANAESEEPPVVFDFLLHGMELLQEELSESNLSFLTILIDLIKKMHDGTEEAYGIEYARQLADRCFEPVWLDYCTELAALPMEQCLNQKTVGLLNALFPPEQQIPYEKHRVTDTGQTVFSSDNAHLEAYAKDGSLLINADLDPCGNITGWKKDSNYCGCYEKGLRHGEGVEYAQTFHHSGEPLLTGLWEHGKFVEGIIHKAILLRSQDCEDGYSYEGDDEDFPSQLSTTDMDLFIGDFAPEQCAELFVCDLALKDGSYDLTGTPTPLCSRLGGPARCHFCWQDSLDFQELSCLESEN